MGSSLELSSVGELLEAEERGLISHLNINKSKELSSGFFYGFLRVRQKHHLCKPLQMHSLITSFPDALVVSTEESSALEFCVFLGNSAQEDGDFISASVPGNRREISGSMWR